MDTIYIIAFLMVISISFILTPIVAKITKQLNIVSAPPSAGSRHIHKRATPRMGGLAIYSAFFIGCAFFVKGDQQIVALLLGGFVIAVSGMLDDLMEISAKQKIAFQIIATLIVIFYGQIRITSINIPGGFKLEFGVLSTLITMLWIIGITNAVNLIDGMDGLCAGVCSIILATIACLSYVQGRTDIVLLSVLLLGATLGFLFFNFYPASIFMGDCGSLFLGYMISTISLLGFKSSAFLTLGPAIFMLAIPIIDTFLSIIRRKVKGVSISTPDKEHLHHTLMYKMNLTHMKTVLTIYAITFYFSQIAYIYLINKRIALIMLIIAAFAVEIFVEKTSMISKKYRPILWLVDLVKTVFGKEPK